MTLVIQQLAHRYDDVQALRGISVAAVQGKITAILGPNASGKSTLLQCIIGAIRPTAGAVMIDGKPAHRLSAYLLASKVAYVPQRSVVAAAFMVREVVELGRYALPTNRAIVDDAIERLELADIQHRPYPALSVGQQQRVTLARAVAQLGAAGSRVEHEAKRSGECYLILDEPMSAMDLRHVRDCSRLLRELASSGITVLIAMHDLALATRLADEAWLLHDGRLAASGAASDVLQLDMLREVYEVGFEWGRREGGEPVLVSEF